MSQQPAKQVVVVAASSAQTQKIILAAGAASLLVAFLLVAVIPAAVQRQTNEQAATVNADDIGGGLAGEIFRRNVSSERRGNIQQAAEQEATATRNFGFMLGVAGIVVVLGHKRLAAMLKTKKQCPKCRAFISADSTKCRHCGSTVE